MGKRKRKRWSAFRVSIEQYMREKGATTDKDVELELLKLMAFNRTMQSFGDTVGFTPNANSFSQLREYVKEVTGYEYDTRKRTYYLPSDRTAK